MPDVHPIAPKRIRVRGTGVRPPGVAMSIVQRLNVTVAAAATSGVVGGWPALSRVRSVTVMVSGIVSPVAPANHGSVTESGNGWAIANEPSAAAGCDVLDSRGRPFDVRSNFTGPPGVRPTAFGLTASCCDRQGRTGASVMAPAGAA